MNEIGAITEFIEAQYWRVESKALKASDRSATWDVNGTWHLEGGEHAVVGEEEAFCHPHNAEHIAFHDPAYVLADIASKRGMLPHLLVEGHELDHCDRCMVLRHLAAPFSGASGYKEDWAV